MASFLSLVRKRLEISPSVWIYETEQVSPVTHQKGGKHMDVDSDFIQFVSMESKTFII